MSAGLLQNILERLARLEQQATAQPGEQLTPNYLTLINGVVGADFTGHVHAQGLDLDAGTSNTPADQDRVRWLRTSDGAAVAYLFGTEVLGRDILQEAALATEASNTARAQLLASSHSGTNQAGFTANAAADTGGSSSASASAGADSVTLIDSSGDSDLLQVAKQLSELPNSTGTSSVSLGSNSPARPASGPWTWIEATARDGTTVWIPAWK